jgi:transcriptional regulator with XRE-family HTH domain
MKINTELTDEAVLVELGARLERTRLERNLSQRELGVEAGVERKAIQRIEAGQPVQITSFIRVLRALGMLDALDRLVPEPTPSPIQLLELSGRSRQRASGARRRAAARKRSDATASPAAQEPASSWHWGDEALPPEDV